MSRVALAALALLWMQACSTSSQLVGPQAAVVGPTAPGIQRDTSAPAFQLATALGPGVNLGNALEAPVEGQWGVTLREEDFALVANAGFTHVRVPIRWSAHAASEAPFTIESEFFERVDWVLQSAQRVGLRVIINVHHYEEMAQEPDKHAPRLAGLWRQIAARYADRADWLYFELLNEPNEALTAERNNQLILEVLQFIRESNPERPVIVGSIYWNAIRGLTALKLPEVDDNLIVTVHYYDPFDYTHQGAPWANKQEQLGVTWPGPVGTEQDIALAFDRAVNWASQHRRPLYLGEFGAFEKAEMQSRVRWTTEVVKNARRHQLSYAYWELRSGFGLYDLEEGWHVELLKAVLPDAKLESSDSAPAADEVAGAPSGEAAAGGGLGNFTESAGVPGK